MPKATFRSAWWWSRGRTQAAQRVSGGRPDLENAQVVRIQFRHLEHRGVAHPAQQARPPRVCKLLMCLAVEPVFQDDRLADYREVQQCLGPKFGRRAAVVVYVWHVLRQSRLIDWLIRAFGWGGLL
jgi:hypothetical protein